MDQEAYIVPTFLSSSSQGNTTANGPSVLLNERICSSIRSKNLATFLYGSKKNILFHQKISQLIEKESIFQSSDRHFQSQLERYLRGCEKGVHLMQKVHEFYTQITDKEDNNNYYCNKDNRVEIDDDNEDDNEDYNKDEKLELLSISSEDFFSKCVECIDEILPMDVHFKMVIPTLTHQTTEEQKTKYLPRAQNLSIICAYAQTELGHGSNIRGLSTLAVFDRKTDCFILNTPSIESFKWWPGGLGKTCTHAIVIARLIIDENQDEEKDSSSSNSNTSSNLQSHTISLKKRKEYGIQAFMVQLRDMQTHQLLKGIKTGDIGPKLGFNSVDNGYLSLTNVFIPRKDMLMGITEVDQNGRVSKKEEKEKILYGAMLHVRSALVRSGGKTLARAVTIASRYSCIRKQGYVPSPFYNYNTGGFAAESFAQKENQVINYPTQQRLLFPLVATSIAFNCIGMYIDSIYTYYTQTLDLSILPYIHALSSGLKAYIGINVANGIEQSRKLCGGHGYMNTSGLPELVNNYVAVNTFEGTKEVLEPQLARFLLKMMRILLKVDHDNNVKNSSSINQNPMIQEEFGYLVSSFPSSSSSSLTSSHTSNDFTKLQVYIDSVDSLLNIPILIHLHESRGAIIAREADKEVKTKIKEFHIAHNEYRTSDQLLSPNTSFSSAYLETKKEQNAYTYALSKSSVILSKLSQAHCQLTVLRKFAEMISTCEENATIGKMEIRVLTLLCQLYALVNIENDKGDFLPFLTNHRSDHSSTMQSTTLIAKSIEYLNKLLRPEIVSIMDSFLYSDHYLNSTLGTFSGNVYEELLKSTTRGSLNTNDVTEGYTMYLRQLLVNENGSSISKL